MGVALLIEKLTGTFCTGLPYWSYTVATIVERRGLVMRAGLAATTSRLGRAPPIVMSIVALPLPVAAAPVPGEALRRAAPGRPRSR